MKRVILESPFAGGVPFNLKYARECAHHCVTKRGESAWGSHMIWPQFLNDEDPAERNLGIEAGFAWSEVADYHVFYTDYGWSQGMQRALAHCLQRRKHFVIRSLYGTSLLPPKPFLERFDAVERRIILAAQEDFQDAPSK
jgi:hypothetical protein